MSDDHSDRSHAIAESRRCFESGRFKQELGALVAIATESQNPASSGELTDYLKTAMFPRFESLGFAVALHSNPEPEVPPLLVANRIENTSAPTILCYGHGDVILGQHDRWEVGLEPFSLIERGDRFYGRGSADNKSQHLINLLALETVIAERGNLGFNAKFLIEMSEETGSTGLEGFCQQNTDLLAADVLIASDGPRLQADTPTIFTGARGSTNFDLVVDLRDGAHHSGNWGGLLADPAILLTQALATVTDKRGQIAIPAWRPNSLTPEVRAILKDLPLDDGSGPGINENWGEKGLTPVERAFGWNSFSILAMKCGVPDSPVNAISGEARATCQLRFVVGTDPEAIIPALREHLDGYGFQCVDIVRPANAYFPATRLSPGNPWLKFASRSIVDTCGKQPHILPNLAGSLPNHCFMDVLDMPTIWIPHSYRGCSQHAPNEHVLKSICREGLEIMTGLYWDIGTPQFKIPT